MDYRDWTAALRSGKYKQGKRQLRKGDLYCCLGIACDISGAGAWKKCDNDETYLYSYYRNAMPAIVVKALNVQELDQNELISMNDGGKTFTEIADYIDAQFEATPHGD